MGALTKTFLGVGIISAIAGGHTSMVQYQAEVGYYDGGEMKWYRGEMTSYERCIHEAVWKYNNVNREARNDDRAFSWICLKWVGNSLAGKVR